MAQKRTLPDMDNLIKKHPPAPDQAAPSQPATNPTSGTVAAAGDRVAKGGSFTVDPSERVTRTLTLRLRESEYQALRQQAFNEETSHQDIMHRALMAYLEKK